MIRLIFFILVTTFYYGVNEACEENKIVLRNQLGPGRIFQYHCRSEKKDLGVLYLNNEAIRIIKIKDEGLTKWHCLLKHGVYMRLYNDIEVYHKSTLDPQCGQLREWSARLSGIWFRKTYKFPTGRARSWFNV